MCKYVKEDGEQCGRDVEPFCHDHEDSQFAVLWRDIHTNGSESALSDLSTVEGQATCDECEEPLTILTLEFAQAAYQPSRVLVQQMISCACEGRGVPYDPVDGGVPKDELPDDWFNHD